MMTALSVIIPERQRGVRGWVKRLRGDRVVVTMRRACGVTVRHVVYTSYSGEVKLEKADEAVGIQRDRLLCSDSLFFPPHSGYRRFRSAAFSSRLCTNFALHVLAQSNYAAGLRTAIYDPNACCADLLPHVLELCSDVTVVTDCFEPYFCSADRALEEQGAAALITKRRGDLRGCDLLIAPTPIREALPVSGNTITLTAGKPSPLPCGTVLWRYQFNMPGSFAAIKPGELSEEYFCSALYTLGAQFELGSIVPLSAGNGSGACDVKSLANLLDNRNQKEYNSNVTLHPASAV